MLIDPHPASSRGFSTRAYSGSRYHSPLFWQTTQDGDGWAQTSSDHRLKYVFWTPYCCAVFRFSIKWLFSLCFLFLFLTLFFFLFIFAFYFSAVALYGIMLALPVLACLSSESNCLLSHPQVFFSLSVPPPHLFSSSSKHRMPGDWLNALQTPDQPIS